jgi:RNA polymerase sigma-70 factor (ECF subfamily)
MNLQTSTFDLVKRFQNGEQSAFNLIFHKYQRRLAVLVYYKMSADLRSRMDVDDILQVVFLKASESLNRFTYQNPGSFMAWLSRLADNAIVDAARFEHREKRYAEDLLKFRSESNPQGVEPMHFETPSRVFARTETMDRLLRSLDALPAAYRQAILLAKFEGLTTSEFAERIGKSREDAALLLHRALKRFRELEQTPEAK